MVECNLAKVDVASSSLVSRSRFSDKQVSSDAGITQLVECNLAKVDVASSSLVSRSKFFQITNLVSDSADSSVLFVFCCWVRALWLQRYSDLNLFPSRVKRRE